jgi:hypothetical protein
VTLRLRRQREQWSKAYVTSRLAPVLRASGFKKAKSDWLLRQGDVTWLVFLSVVRDSRGDIYELSCQVYSTPEGFAPTNENKLAFFGCADLPSVVAPKAFGPKSRKSIAEFVAVVQDVVCPLMVELDTTEKVVAAKIDRRLGWKQLRPYVAVVDGWRRAVKFEVPLEAERALAILRSMQVERRDKERFDELMASEGVPLRG